MCVGPSESPNRPFFATRTQKSLSQPIHGLGGPIAYIWDIFHLKIIFFGRLGIQMSLHTILPEKIQETGALRIKKTYFFGKSSEIRPFLPKNGLF